MSCGVGRSTCEFDPETGLGDGSGFFRDRISEINVFVRHGVIADFSRARVLGHARMAMVSKATVLRAIAWLSLYGFLDKLRRIVRTTGLLGPRVRQTSNAYVLRFPKGLGALAANVFNISPECHNSTPSESNSEVKKVSDEVRVENGLKDALERLRFSVRGQPAA